MIYVIVDGILLVSKALVYPERMHHSVLAGGRPVQAAGEVDVISGEGYRLVLNLNNLSGHYQPSASCLDWAVAVFSSLGFEIGTDAVQPYTGGIR